MYWVEIAQYKIEDFLLIVGEDWTEFSVQKGSLMDNASTASWEDMAWVP